MSSRGGKRDRGRGLDQVNVNAPVGPRNPHPGNDDPRPSFMPYNAQHRPATSFKRPRAVAMDWCDASTIQSHDVLHDHYGLYSSTSDKNATRREIKGTDKTGSVASTLERIVQPTVNSSTQAIKKADTSQTGKLKASSSLDKVSTQRKATTATAAAVCPVSAAPWGSSTEGRDRVVGGNAGHLGYSARPLPRFPPLSAPSQALLPANPEGTIVSRVIKSVNDSLKNKYSEHQTILLAQCKSAYALQECNVRLPHMLSALLPATGATIHLPLRTIPSRGHTVDLAPVILLGKVSSVKTSRGTKTFDSWTLVDEGLTCPGAVHKGSAELRIWQREEGQAFIRDVSVCGNVIIQPNDLLVAIGDFDLLPGYAQGDVRVTAS